MSRLKNGYIPKVLATEYASYRDTVLRTLITRLETAQASISRPISIYDPMAGTGPLIPEVERSGYVGYFNDLNSLHLYVNKAKTYRSYKTFKRIGSATLLKKLCNFTSRLDRNTPMPTEKWIDDVSLRILSSAWSSCEDEIKPVTIILKAIILLSIRDFSSFVKTKNPTWLKPGGTRRNITVEQAFSYAINMLENYYQHTYCGYQAIKGGEINLTDRDCTKYVPKSGVDIVLTSPPYCNRVDWDRLYAPEHYFLRAVGVWHTRCEFIGTTAVRHYDNFDSDIAFISEHSKYLNIFLTKVKERQIGNEKRSDYYLKYFTRYFAGLFRVFEVAASSLHKNNFGIYFVVQDNCHRGMSIDIGRVISQYLSIKGFQTRVLKIWNQHHLGMRNISRKYRAVNPRQRESLWHAIK